MTNNGQQTSGDTAWTISSGSGDFQHLPEGMVNGFVQSVSDPFEEEDKYSETPGKMKKKFYITFGSSDHQTDDGEPMTIRAKLTASLHPKSTFRKYLNGILERDLEPAELVDFSPRSIEGEACRLIVSHQPRNDGNGIWSSVDKVMKAAA
jgi:hypothetical protein